MTDFPFAVATSFSAIAEIGDKSQLMALLLGLRFRRPLVILLGIFAATLANNVMAGLAGEWLGRFVEAEVLGWGIALLFAAMAIWVAVPDKTDPDDVLAISRGGIVLASALSFFLAEIGSRSQLAAITVAAQFQMLVPVVLGATAGILLVNLPVLLLGSGAGNWAARPGFRAFAAGLFALSSLLTALEAVR